MRRVTAAVVCWLILVPLVSAADWIDRRGTAVSQAAVIERIERADIVLLGEVHDSPHVHAHQVELLEALGKRPLVLAMEQLDLEHREALQRLDDQDVTDGRALAEAGRFDESGWGWEYYGPLFALAAERGWPVRPINLSRERARGVARSGDEWRLALTPEQVAVIEPVAPDLALPPDDQAALVDDLIRVHCGDMEPAFARRIARAQVARDILMADAVLAVRRELPDRTVVAIMGNQHARWDRGAGYWIARMIAEGRGASGNRMVSMGMLPVGKADRTTLRREGSEQYQLIRFADPDDASTPCASD